MAAVHLIFLSLLVNGAAAFSWDHGSLPDGASVHARTMQDFTFNWTCAVGWNQTLRYVKWFVVQQDRLRPVAEYYNGTNGYFMFHPLPGFHDRQQHGDYGRHDGLGVLIMDGVTYEDNGNYSVEISYRTPKDIDYIERRWAYLKVGDPHVTQGGKLRVQQSNQAVLDQGSQQWHVPLTCGPFLATQRPPWNVTWTLPGGKTVNSSDYEGGHFSLLLPASPESGIYTCTLPSAACSPCPSGQQREASVTVDAVAARLAVLEAQQGALTEENVALKKDNQRLNDLFENALDHIDPEGAGKKAHRVAFEAWMGYGPDTYNGSDVLQFTQVELNLGRAFNASTGVFTAPRAGVYVFLVSVASAATHISADVQLKVDGAVITRAYAMQTGFNSFSSSGQGVVELQRGQRVWAECFVNTAQCTFWTSATFFSGFML